MKTDRIMQIHARKKEIISEQHRLLSKHNGSTLERFNKMAELNPNDRLIFIELESEHLELNQELIKIGLSVNQIKAGE